MEQEAGEDALRELEHQLRNELFALQLRGALSAEQTARRRAELEASLAEAQAALAAIAGRA